MNLISYDFYFVIINKVLAIFPRKPAYRAFFKYIFVSHLFTSNVCFAQLGYKTFYCGYLLTSKDILSINSEKSNEEVETSALTHEYIRVELVF